MFTTTVRLSRRDLDYYDCRRVDDGGLTKDEVECKLPFWSTKEGSIIKWSLFLGFIVACALYLLIGYIHAHRRIKKNLPPLAYHRFLISRDVLARVDPRYGPPPPNPNNPYLTRPPSAGHDASAYYYPWAPMPQYVDMYAMPPPMYDPNAPRPPKYEPPASAPAPAPAPVPGPAAAAAAATTTAAGTTTATTAAPASPASPAGPAGEGAKDEQQGQQQQQGVEPSGPPPAAGQGSGQQQQQQQQQ